MSKCLGLPVACPAITNYPLKCEVNISHMSHIYRYFKAEIQTNSNATGIMYYSSLSPVGLWTVFLTGLPNAS